MITHSILHRTQNNVYIIDPDFGDLARDEFKKKNCGTFDYRPLHLFTRHVSRQEDIFSLGRILAEMFGATRLQKACDEEEYKDYSTNFMRYSARKIRNFLKNMPAFSINLIGLLGMMQHDDASIRPKANNISVQFINILNNHLPQEVRDKILVPSQSSLVAIA